MGQRPRESQHARLARGVDRAPGAPLASQQAADVDDAARRQGLGGVRAPLALQLEVGFEVRFQEGFGGGDGAEEVGVEDGLDFVVVRVGQEGLLADAGGVDERVVAVLLGG